MVGRSTTALAFAPDGNLWFGSRIEAKLFKMTPLGEVTELGGLTTIPVRLRAVKDGTLWYGGIGNKVGHLYP